MHILSPDGEKILLQKRCQTKEPWPGLWDVSVGGHVDAGEFGYQAIIREAEEELGLTLAPSDLLFIGCTTSSTRGGKDNHFNEYYVMQLDLDPAACVLQKDEVDEVRWLDTAELAERIHDNCRDLTPKVGCWAHLLKYLESASSPYLFNLHPKIKEYYKILEPEGIPDWLLEYIETPEMLHQDRISMTCGTIYSNLFDSHFFYSSLAHSVAVALIVWHFTRDKKQTLAGLFHDIATPAFKHCVDFLDGDYAVEESTEELTTEIISNSEEIMALLSRDGIDVCEVDDYHIYPIADNDTPRLAADRLEYSMSNAAFTYSDVGLDAIRRFYNDLSVQKNEDGLPELGFRHKTIARDFVKLTSQLSIIYRAERTTFSMEFIAHVLRGLSHDGLICREDLWRLSEDEMINLIMGSRFAEPFKIWRDSSEILTADAEPTGYYYVHDLQTKMRYIDPLINGKRASATDEASAAAIQENLSYKMSKYMYLDFSMPSEE